jgi:hypothetical protein
MKNKILNKTNLYLTIPKLDWFKQFVIAEKILLIHIPLTKQCPEVLANMILTKKMKTFHVPFGFNQVFSI